jgi:hypothetical protein
VTRIVEYDNPPFLLLRDGREEEVERTEIALESSQNRKLRFSRFQTRMGDRIVFFSDGVTQAGMGEHRTPLGWGWENVAAFLRNRAGAQPAISARDLARQLVAQAIDQDHGIAKDDISASVLYYREPRRLLVITGPPFSKTRDRELMTLAKDFSGRKAICGGTTADIVSRLLGRTIHMDLSYYDPEIPPAAAMEGFDLITEGTLTMGRVARILESGADPETLPPNAATRLSQLLLDSDIVQFAVGTRINQAHQDPNIPLELELRRNVVRRIAQQLERGYRKEVLVEFR